MDIYLQIEWIKYLTILITLFGTYLGYQQYKINQYKVKLDLYEKRYNVVSGYKKTISILLRNGTLTDDELRDYLISTKESIYFFDDLVNRHINDVYEKFISIQMWTLELKTNTELDIPLRKDYSEKSKETLTYFNRLIKSSDEKYFKKYLDFTKLS